MSREIPAGRQASIEILEVPIEHLLYIDSSLRSPKESFGQNRKVVLSLKKELLPFLTGDTEGFVKYEDSSYYSK